MNNRIALCQCCVRVIQVNALIPDDNNPPGRCPVCGGETCDCRGCLSNIPALARGDWAVTNLQPHSRKRAISWSADDGLVLAPEVAP
ncbi:MAG: hypothetical protein ABSA58_15840 [Acetobacteraceae bacterium]|jgi:hypothetical protein